MNDLATFIITILNALVAAYVLLYKGRREGKKLEVESESVAAEVAERNLKSAEISNQMLVDSVNRLKQELEEERQARKADLEQERQARKAEVEAERETRKKEVSILEEG